MLQGFYWESYRHGHPTKFPQHGTKVWYDIVKDMAGEIREGHFDLIWLPPPSHATPKGDGEFSAGYGPREYFDLNNSYGTQAQQRAMLEALLSKGVEPIADIVINHRNGTEHWADFTNPSWDTKTITRDDEAFIPSTDCAGNKCSEVKNLPEVKRGNPEERPPYRPDGNYAYNAFRDIDHTNKAALVQLSGKCRSSCQGRGTN